MKLIPLSKNSKSPDIRGKYFAMVDDEDYDYLMKWDWFVARDRITSYAKRHAIDTTTKKQISITMHSAIIGHVGNLEVDHIDHDGLNNQRANIRTCTRQENTRYRRSKKNGSSKYLGVCWVSTRGKWRSQIMYENKQLFLGRYDSEVLAAKVYDEKAKELFGNFANLNFKNQNDTHTI